MTAGVGSLGFRGDFGGRWPSAPGESGVWESGLIGGERMGVPGVVSVMV